MEAKINITPTIDQLAEMLFELDNKQVAELFGKWRNLFEEEYQRRKDEGEVIWIFDLNHFMLYVADELDDDGIDFFRSAYASIVYKFCDKITKKHLLKLN